MTKSGLKLASKNLFGKANEWDWVGLEELQ